MDRRRQQRVFVELPVQIWGMDANSRPFTQSASLRTISGRGATLQGVDVQLKAGDVVDLQYAGAKAQFASLAGEVWNRNARRGRRGERFRRRAAVGCRSRPLRGGGRARVSRDRPQRTTIPHYDPWEPQISTRNVAGRVGKAETRASRVISSISPDRFRRNNKPTALRFIHGQLHSISLSLHSAHPKVAIPGIWFRDLM